MAVNTESFSRVLRELGVSGQVRELPEPAPTAVAAAGHPHTVFPTTYSELLRITAGTPADVGG